MLLRRRFANALLAAVTSLAAAAPAAAQYVPKPSTATPGLTASSRLHGSCAAYAAMREAAFPEAVAVARGGPAPRGEDARRNAVEGLRWAHRRAYAEERAGLAVLREAGRPGAAPDLETLLAWWSGFIGDIPAGQREAWAQVTCPTIYDAADASCAQTACDVLPD